MYLPKTAEYTSLYHQQSLLLLMAGKCKRQRLLIPEHSHVELLNWGGLWKINTDAVATLSAAESYFFIFI